MGVRRSDVQAATEKPQAGVALPDLGHALFLHPGVRQELRPAFHQRHRERRRGAHGEPLRLGQPRRGVERRAEVGELVAKDEARQAVHEPQEHLFQQPNRRSRRSRKKKGKTQNQNK
jgi:hypothetical protein